MHSKASQVLSTRVYLRAAAPALCSLWLVWMFSTEILQVDLIDLRARVASYSAATWVTALVFTWISFAAVSGYDPIAGKILGTNIPVRRARSMSWKATAIPQLVGFGLITGTLVRWLEFGLNPDKSEPNTLGLAFKLTLTVSASFISAWAFITVTFAAFSFLSPFQFVALCLAIILVANMAKNSNFPALRKLITHQSTYIRLVLLTVVDTVFAALVIYVLLPPDLASFSTVYLAFLLSYTAGLMSGLPGGIGPFEICMIALLPALDASLLAPALLGFRIVYFAIPAIMALVCIMFERNRRPVSPSFSTKTSQLPIHLRRAAPPELDLIHNNQLSCFVSKRRSEATLALSNDTALIQLGDSFGDRLTCVGDKQLLENTAKWSKQSFCIYRCNRVTATQAKASGMKSILFSSEAIIRTSEFDMKTPAMSGLRRKVRKAAKAGVLVNTRNPNLCDLSDIDAQWKALSGQARGFSTGTFSKDFIKRQRIYVAYLGDVPVAFITVSVSRSSWQLDLIRHGKDCPDGTIYALVIHAVADARLCGVAHLSLGSVPFSPPIQKATLKGQLCRLVFKQSASLKGLYQFKRAFDPEWHDRYFVVPSYVSGLQSAYAVHRAINAPSS